MSNFAVLKKVSLWYVRQLNLQNNKCFQIHLVFKIKKKNGKKN